MFEIRTDLAVEERERFLSDAVEIKGVRLEEEHRGEDLTITRVVIETENGARAMAKPKGRYFTLEAPKIQEAEEAYMEEVKRELAGLIREVLPADPQELSILVVGLGNRQVTPDSLGPKVVDQLKITRHIQKEYGAYAFGEEKVATISGLVPGVMAQTGMESVEIIQGIVRQTAPDCVVVVDALAARSIHRLNRTIQITDTGINPGSGVGNHRRAIHQKQLGVPVIAIGIPTVVDAATIVNDALCKQNELSEEIAPGLNTLFVTPKDVDESVLQLSFILAGGLNQAFLKDG